MSPPLLEVDRLVMRFGGLTAVQGLSFAVQHGTIHGLIGPNGAGTTTTFNVISGFYAPSSGQEIYLREHVSRHATCPPPERRLIRSFQ